MRRYLIITGDDFGFSQERNKGVMEAYSKGAITSASLLLNCTGTEEAVTMFKDSQLCPGLHLNLTEGLSISNYKFQTLTNKTCTFHGMFPTLELFEVGSVGENEIEEEIDCQIEKFKEMMGEAPVYVDGHQHIHLHPKVVEIFAAALKRHNISITRYPLEINMASKNWVNPEYIPFFTELVEKCQTAKKTLDKYGIRTTDSFVGLSTMGSNMTIDRLQHIILEAFQDAENGLRPEHRDFTTCELMTHPGYPTPQYYGGFSWGTDEFGSSDDRVHEINVLSSMQMKIFYKENNIEIVSHKILLAER